MEALLRQYADQAKKIAEQEAQEKFANEYLERIRILEENSGKKSENIEKLTNDYNSIIVKLEESKLEFEREKEEFIKHERKNIAAALKITEAQQLVNLNVGGKKFKTTVDTLTKYEDSIFPVLLSGKFKEDPEKEIFIDRDGQAFKYIMTFLRNGEYIAPSDPAMQKLVMCEIDYFGLSCLLSKNPAVNPSYYGINNFFPYEAYFTPEFKNIRTEENNVRIIRNSDDNVHLANKIREKDEPFLLKVFSEEFQQMYYNTTNPQINQEIMTSDKKINLVTEKQFGGRFAKYSNNLFDHFDWKNVCVAGGSVVRCLLGNLSVKDPKPSYSDEPNQSSKGTDIDLFIYGLTNEESVAKLMQIYDYFRNKFPNDIFWVRTISAFTICLKYPNKHIQIVLRVYKDITDVLTTFDLDSSCVAFTGTKTIKGITTSEVFCTPRFKHAITYGTNIVDPARQSETYEFRLYKYKLMGFSITVPGYNHDMINPHTNLSSLYSTNGLKRLLIIKQFEKLTGNGMDATRCNCRNNQYDNRSYRENICKIHRKVTIMSSSFQSKSITSIDNLDEMRENEIEDPSKFSDYCSTFIPHGYIWNNETLENLYTIRMHAYVNSGNNKELHHIFMHKGRSDVTHFDVLDDEIERITGAVDEITTFTIPKKLTFEEPTVGKKMRGSFHPTNFDYYGDCLLVSKINS